MFRVHDHVASLHAHVSKLRTTSLDLAPPVAVDVVRRIGIDTVDNREGDTVEQPYYVIVIIHFRGSELVWELGRASSYCASFAEHAVGRLLGAIVMTVNGGVRVAEFGVTAQSCGEREFVAVLICNFEILDRAFGCEIPLLLWD